MSDKPSLAFTAPIKSASGRASSLDRPQSKPAKEPQWTYWTLMKSVTPWKLAALSLGIEPASVDPHEITTFPDEATFGRFTLITAAIKKRFGAHDHQHISVEEFVRWGIAISLAMPPELRALTDTVRGG